MCEDSNGKVTAPASKIQVGHGRPPWLVVAVDVSDISTFWDRLRTVLVFPVFVIVCVIKGKAILR